MYEREECNAIRGVGKERDRSVALQMWCLQVQCIEVDIQGSERPMVHHT